MKTMTLVLAAMLLGTLRCTAGTNVTIRTIGDEHGEAHVQVYSHGTNVVLKIRQAGKGVWVTSDASGYSITHTDENGDGITESIMISRVGGNILEVLKRNADGRYIPSSQRDVDEMNIMRTKIEAGIYRKSDKAAPKASQAASLRAEPER